MKHSKLKHDFIVEQAYKNQAYFFILSKNLFDDFKRFCNQYPLDTFWAKTPIETLQETPDILGVSRETIRETIEVENDVKENIMNK